MIAHSPGPWCWHERAQFIGNEAGNIILAVSASSTCGRSDDDYYGCNNHAAKARLFLKPTDRAVMVAAPELLASLRAVAGVFPPNSGNSDVTVARALLARLDGAA